MTRPLKVAILVAISIKLVLMLTTNGTMDAVMWDASAAQIRSQGGESVYVSRVPLYPGGTFTHAEVFNHPPFMVHALRLLGGLSQMSGIRVRQWIRLWCLLADVGTVLLVSRIVQATTALRPGWPMLLVALAPAHLLITGFHTNTDPVMVFLMVCGAYFLEVRRSPALGGAAMGAAMCIKVVPALVLPAMLVWLRTWKQRAQFAAAFGGLWLLASLPWLVMAPREIVGNLLGYGSRYGWWGLAWIATDLRTQAPWFDAWFASIGRFAVLAIAAGAGCVLVLRRPGMSLMYATGVVFSAFLFLTPGFAVQYFAWMTPWLAVVPFTVGAAHAAAAGASLTLIYFDWMGGASRRLADGLLLGQLDAVLAVTMFAAWLSVLAVLIALARNARASLRPREATGTSKPDDGAGAGVAPATPG